MEDILYNILWIDDEHEGLGGFKGQARNKHGIELVGFKSLNAGMEELEKNYSFYDGVLLDAKFFENEDDIAGTEDTYNVHRAKERVIKIKKNFEIFVLTGQAEAFDDNTFKKAFTNIYRKASTSEIDRLFKDLKKAAKGQEDAQIRHAYKRVFDVCTERYIGEQAGRDLLNILKEKDDAYASNDFNVLRKIVEDIFSGLNKYKLLPTAFVSPDVSLNEGSKFLTGKNWDGIYFEEKGFKHLDGTHLPLQITRNLRAVLSITQAGSHRSQIDEHTQLVNTPYLFKSVLYQLLDVIVWFKLHVDSKPKTENWEEVTTSSMDVEETKVDLQPGKVFSIVANKGFAFFKPDALGDNIFIPPNLVTDHELVEEMAIWVDTEEYIDNRSQERKTRVKYIEVT